MNNNAKHLNRHGIKVKKGDILNGKYLVLSHISSGGMSEVYLVEEIANPEKRWAVKITKISNPLSKNILDETNILSELDHPNMPYVVDFFTADECYFLVMEYIDGVALSDYFTIHNQQLPLELTIEIAKQLCDVLEFLHARKPYPIIYRDVKPGNILIKEDHTIKLIDFGTARKYQENGLSDTASVGTVGFAAPEQFDKKRTDQRTDLFSFGALLYYLLSKGKYVYVAQKPIKSFHSSLPKSLEKCVTKLVEIEPNNRIQSTAETRELLRNAENELKKSKNRFNVNRFGSFSLFSISLLFIGFLIFTLI